MQYLLTQAIEVIVFVFVASFINELVYNIFNPIQQIQCIHSTDSVVQATEESVQSQRFATLDWVQPVCEVEYEPVNVISLAIPRMKVVDLKKLASVRQVKGYGKMRKTELISSLV